MPQASYSDYQSPEESSAVAETGARSKHPVIISAAVARQNRHITTNCEGAAGRLAHVLTWMKDNGHMNLILRDFAHSASCRINKCSPYCMMFRRVRRHVASVKPPCALLRLYARLLHMHVDKCNIGNCGLQSCPSLRKIRRKHGGHGQYQWNNPAANGPRFCIPRFLMFPPQNTKF